MHWHTLCFLLYKYSVILHIRFLFLLCFWTWIWIVLVSHNLNGSDEPFPAKKVADTLPLGNISPAAPCLVVLVVNVWQQEEHMSSFCQITLFSQWFFNSALQLFAVFSSSGKWSLKQYFLAHLQSLSCVRDTQRKQARNPCLWDLCYHNESPADTGQTSQEDLPNQSLFQG